MDAYKCKCLQYSPAISGQRSFKAIKVTLLTFIAIITPHHLTNIFFLLTELKSSWSLSRTRWYWTIPLKTRSKTNEAVPLTCHLKFYAQTPPTRGKRLICGRLASFYTRCSWEGELLVYARKNEDVHECLRLLGNGKSHESSR